MGTTVEVIAPIAVLTTAAERIHTLFETWEAVLSRFRDESELSALNRQSGRPVRVSPLLWQVLTEALAAARATGGLYDPGMDGQLRTLGYGSDFERMSRCQPSAPRTPQRGGKWRQIACRREDRTVTLPLGMRLDFGGIAKGMAVDAGIDQLASSGLSPVLVNAGGDLAVHGLPPARAYWPVAVGSADDEVVGLVRGAMATSGPSRRQWIQGGLHRHHLLDPATGFPAQSDLVSVSVLAPRCAQADVAAKVAWILGAEGGEKFLQQNGLSGLLIEPGGTIRRVGEWPEKRRDE